MFGPVVSTPYDLQFSLFGIPVRVLPWFWLTSALLGWGAMEDGLPALLLWMFAVFISILVHEFGHALTARAFGYYPTVLLIHFGGLAVYTPGYDHTLWRSILISAAGPLAGLLLAAICFGGWLAISLAAVEVPPGAQFFLSAMLQINIGWSIMNLLPVLPLDGGQICRDVLRLITPDRGQQIALVISVVVGGIVAAIAVASQQTYLAIMFGFMAMSALGDLQQRRY